MHDESPQLDPLVGAYYERVAEESRLEVGAFRLEEARTRELVLRHAPSPPARVLDVGGAAGAYAFWLAERGYEVSLVDAAPRLVAIARSRSERVAYPLASCTVGDARALSEPDGSADMVLLLGPLYHLVDARERRRALFEAVRVLRPGGVLIAACISRWASTLDGLSHNVLSDPAFARIVERDLVDGQHRNPTDRLEYFTTAYFHKPEELRDEVGAAGLTIEGLYGVEGPGWILPDFMERWNNERGRDDLLRVARICESEPSMIGCSAHLLVVGRKPQPLRQAPNTAAERQ
jgi:SAM-dependent methyltransferase